MRYANAGGGVQGGKRVSEGCETVTEAFIIQIECRNCGSRWSVGVEPKYRAVNAIHGVYLDNGLNRMDLTCMCCERGDDLEIIGREPIPLGVEVRDVVR